MCGYCIEDIYFTTDYSSLRSDRLFNLIHLMESPDWEEFYQSLDAPQLSFQVVGVARELEERIDGCYYKANVTPPSYSFSPNEWSSWVSQMRGFQPDDCLGDLLVGWDFVPCNRLREEDAAARFLREFINRYFDLPEGHCLRIEGEWNRWKGEEEAYHFFWAYIALAISTHSPFAFMERYYLAFLELKHAPSFSGWELWMQRQALAKTVLEHGVGVFNSNPPVRPAMVKGARLRTERQHAWLGSAISKMRRIEAEATSDE